jgi:hypothetical protein
MKSMNGLVFGWGLLVSLWARADGAEISRPFWVIVVTVTDKTTGTEAVGAADAVAVRALHEHLERGS